MMQKAMAILFMIPLFFIGQGALDIAYSLTIDPFNYGTITYTYRGEDNITINVESTNSSVPPYGNGVSVMKSVEGYVPPYNGGSSIYSYEQRSIIEFEQNNILTDNYYYLVLSPWSTYGGNGITQRVDIFNYIGDGYIQEDDYASGNYAGFADITSPDLVSWYQNNDIGGYLGDTMYDITNIVNDSISNGVDYLGFNIRTQIVIIENSVYTGVLFRKPYILSTSEPIESSPVPEPSTILLLGSGLLGLVAIKSRKKKS